MAVLKFLIIISPLFILVYNKEHRATSIHAYSRGAMAAVFALLLIGVVRISLGFLYSSIHPTIWDTISITIEEVAKMASFIIFLRRQDITRHLIRYAVAVAIGFACTESLLYISASVTVILLRVSITSLLHIATLIIIAVLGGYYHQYKRQQREEPKSSRSLVYDVNILRSTLIVPVQVAIHLGYNMIAKNIM